MHPVLPTPPDSRLSLRPFHRSKRFLTSSMRQADKRDTIYRPADRSENISSLSDRSPDSMHPPITWFPAELQRQAEKKIACMPPARTRRIDRTAAQCHPQNPKGYTSFIIHLRFQRNTLHQKKRERKTLPLLFTIGSTPFTAARRLRTRSALRGTA